MMELVAEVTSYSFDSSLFVRVIEAEQRPLANVATMLEQFAKSLVLGSRRKSLSELSPNERRSIFRGRSLPWVHSRPGEPPRSPTGRFRASILGAVDPSMNSAVAGATGGRLPKILESGGQINGHYIAARPLMQPVLNRNLTKITPLFAELL